MPYFKESKCMIRKLIKTHILCRFNYKNTHIHRYLLSERQIIVLSLLKSPKATDYPLYYKNQAF